MDNEITSLYIRKGSGGTKPWYKWLAYLTRSTRWDGNIGSPDEHVFITCQCGAEFSAAGEDIHWCPQCHRGYMTELKVWKVPAWMYKLRRTAHQKPSQKYVDQLKGEIEHSLERFPESSRRYQREYYEKMVQRLQDDIDDKLPS